MKQTFKEYLKEVRYYKHKEDWQADINDYGQSYGVCPKCGGEAHPATEGTTPATAIGNVKNVITKDLRRDIKMKINQLMEAKYKGQSPIEGLAIFVVNTVMSADSDSGTLDEFIKDAEWYITNQLYEDLMPLIHKVLKQRFANQTTERSTLKGRRVRRPRS